MVEFKKGDRVLVSGERGDYRNGKGVVVDFGSVMVCVRLDTGKYVVAHIGNVHHYVEPVSPPQKITQNGYEYSLIGPVKPEWLVDGAWVVRNDNGCKHQVVLNKNGLLVLTIPGIDTTILPNHHIYDQFRPHEPKDWKWGDWALYAGRKVFVMTSTNNHGCVAVSYPDIYPLGANEANRNFLLVKHDELTPTF